MNRGPTFCQTLWRGAHLYFGLRLMGFDNVRGYDGSWVEWGNRSDLPVVTGPAPGSLAKAGGIGEFLDSTRGNSEPGLPGDRPEVAWEPPLHGFGIGSK